MRTRLLLAACAAAFSALGCGEEQANSDGGPPPVDALDARPFGACSPLAPGDKPRDPGACCIADTDCMAGFCISGWCSRNCSSDNQCQPNGPIGTPTPFGQGTQMRCLVELGIGVQGYCWPGSGDRCDGTDGSCTKPGERCGVWFNERGTPNDAGLPIADGLHPRCIASYATPRQGQTGERCDIEDPYQCANPVGLYHNCLGGACTQGCDMTTPGACPANAECFGPLTVALRSNGQIYEGAGLCLGPSCGKLQFSNPPRLADIQHVEPPGSCGAGRYCAPFPNFKAGEFDTIYLLCATADPNPMRAVAGAPCQQDPKLEVHCREELACLQIPPTPNTGGTPCASSAECTSPSAPVCVTPQGQYAGGGALGTCSPRPPDGFCSVMCRSDGDCLTLPGSPFGTVPPPICVQTRYETLPNGATTRIPFCFDHPHTFDFEPPQCQSEAACGTQQPHISCIPVSNRSEQAFCASGHVGNVNGATCNVGNAVCAVGSLCLRASDGQLHCTDVSTSLFEGAPCQQGGDCASGTCWDRRARSALNSPATARCTAVCRQSAFPSRSDCVAGSTCVPIRLHGNGTPDSSDDTVMGFCLTQTPEVVAEQCRVDADCLLIGHGDKCNMSTKACYGSTALVGDACSNDGDCKDGDTCLHPPDFPWPGGYCVRYGCDLLTTRTDNGGCPAEAVCVAQGGGTGTCERSCLRVSDCRSGYDCVNIGTPSNPINICQPL